MTKIFVHLLNNKTSTGCVMTGLVTVAFLMGLTGIQQMGVQAHVSSCDGSRGTPRKYSDDVPCNLNEKSYCTEPGDAYPKHAVSRFVSDNQGLMRRMYGDLRHLTVLRSEMEWENFDDVQQEVRGSPPVAFEELNSLESQQNEDINDTSTTSTALPVNHKAHDQYVANSTDIPSVGPDSANNSKSTADDNVEKSSMDKGISACPTKKEVVAPYWAVNTRGRTLAIVNDPPYEQHIHWEKCLHENKQMLCRAGCKCEQQQRLQRLLAFDPNCDCKGVFMDWFLLPSCCVCKCYGLAYGNATASAQNVTSGRRTGRLAPYGTDDQTPDPDW